MYAERLRAYVTALGRLAEVAPSDVRLLEESLACYLSLFAAAVGGIATPMGDLLETSIRLSLLTRSLTRGEPDQGLDGIHYLVAMGYEQSGAVFRTPDRSRLALHPLENPAWYRLLLATLHYLAGGYRVQALCSRRATARVAGSHPLYPIAARMLEFAFEGATNPNLLADIERLTEGYPSARETLSSLILAIQRRADVLLANLGEGNLTAWAQQHNLDKNGAEFWGQYLRRLRDRGITSFTREQGAFDQWLVRDADLLVQLPTGAGKSIVGELLTALHLAAGFAVVWLLPTRALVRQFKREIARAFSALEVDVEELPATEDVLPLFADELPVTRQVAVTTPERLSALVRANANALSGVGLVVFDEAHLLLEKSRGVTAEHVLRVARTTPNSCRLTLMTGFADAREPLERAMAGLGAPPRVLVSEVRPTRRICQFAEGRDPAFAEAFPPGSASAWLVSTCPASPPFVQSGLA